MLNESSNIMVFERPQDGDLVRKWQLLCEGEISHVVIMPNLTKETIVVFVVELVQSRLILSKGGAIPPPCIAGEVGDENCRCNDHLRDRARK